MKELSFGALWLARGVHCASCVVSHYSAFTVRTVYICLILANSLSFGHLWNVDIWGCAGLLTWTFGPPYSNCAPWPPHSALPSHSLWLPGSKSDYTCFEHNPKISFWVPSPKMQQNYHCYPIQTYIFIWRGVQARIFVLFKEGVQKPWVCDLGA